MKELFVIILLTIFSKNILRFRMIEEYLLQKSIKWAEQSEFNQIYLTLSKESEAKTIRDYKFYESNGFKFHHETISYSIDLLAHQLQEIQIPSGFELKQISEVDQEQLFICVHETLKERKTFFCYDQKFEDCREYFFNNLCQMDSMGEENSIVLLKNQKVIGFTYVLAFGEDFLFLDWIGIHPSYRKQGLGTFLLRYVMTRAHESGIKSMGLSCESDNVSARTMYERNNWVPSDLEVTYAWKKN